MEVGDIVVEVRDRDRNPVGKLTDEDLLGFTLVPRFNAVGSWQVTLPASVIDPETGAEYPHALCAALRRKGAGLAVYMPGGREVSGPMVTSTFHADTTDPGGTWTITGTTDEQVLDDSLCFPDPSSADPGVQAAANDIRTGARETVLRAMFSDNIGPDSTTSRRWDHLTVAPDLGRGGTVTVSPRFTKMLTQFQTTCGAVLGFTVVQDGSSLQLQFFEPVDRSNDVAMDVWNDQLSDAQYSFSAPTTSLAIVAGQGEGTDRTIISRSSQAAEDESAAWGRRVEVFIDQRQTDDLVELQQAGDKAVDEGGVTITSLQVTPADADSMRLGVDWWVGDLVTVIVDGTPATAIVSSVLVSVTESGVTVLATVGDPVGFDPEDVTESRLSDTENRVSSLERNAEVASFDWADLHGPVKITSNTDESPSSTDHPLSIGAGPVVKFDSNQIDAYGSETGGEAQTLYIQNDADGPGGALVLGGQGGLTGSLTLASDGTGPLLASQELQARIYEKMSGAGGPVVVTPYGTLGRWAPSPSATIDCTVASGWSVQDLYMWEPCPGLVYFRTRVIRTGATLTTGADANIADTLIFTLTDSHWVPQHGANSGPLFFGGKDGYNILSFRLAFNLEFRLVGGSFPNQQIATNDALLVNGIYTLV